MQGVKQAIFITILLHPLLSLLKFYCHRPVKRDNSGSDVTTKPVPNQLPRNVTTPELANDKTVKAQDREFAKSSKKEGLLEKYIPASSKSAMCKWDYMSQEEISNLDGLEKQAYLACMRQRKKRLKNKTKEVSSR